MAKTYLGDSVDAETYDGKLRHKIGFLRSYDAVPGASLSGVDADRAKALQSKHGASLRAIGGNVKRNSALPPGNKPPPPPPAAAPQNAEKAEIPF